MERDLTMGDQVGGRLSGAGSLPSVCNHAFWGTVNLTSAAHLHRLPQHKLAAMVPAGWGLLSCVMIAGLSGCGGMSGPTADKTPTPSLATSSAPGESDLQQAARACGLNGSEYAVIGDAGYTLTLQGKPKNGSRGGLSLKEMACVLNGVKVPDNIASQMDGTRALDGMQRAAWRRTTATWTYRPDNGFRIILTESK